GRTIQVADKGLNCAENIFEARKHGDGYLFSKSVKILPEKDQKWVLLETDYKIVRDEKGKEKYRWKEWIETFHYQFKISETGKMKKFSVKEKRIVLYNPNLARKKKIEINRRVEKAKKLVHSSAKKSEYGEAAKYITIRSVDEDGVINEEKPVIEINQKAIEKDLRLAGYNLLVTSETKMKAEEIYKTYHQLWKIEDTFRVMKSELDTRPIYLQKPERIYGHFLVCYITILLTRIFQIKILKDRYKNSEIYDLFHNLKVTQTQKIYVNCSQSSKLLEDMSRIYNLPLTNYYLDKNQIKKVLSYRLTPIA
ncbi:MAG: transposase, partial [Allobaculum sp.]|nr:transposase [Allobaculum sp.]